MKPLFFRIAQVSAIALVACSVSAPALAKKAAARPAASSSSSLAAQLQETQQRLAEMRAQLNAMQARIDAQQQGGQNEVAQQALTTAQQAQATAAAAQASAEKSSKDSGALAKAVSWAKDTKISGRMYFNMSSVTGETAAGVNNEKDGGFAIKRFYVGIDHKFDDIFSGNVTMDIDNVAGTTGNLVGKGFYVKKAYLQAKLNKAFVVRLGSTDLPWIPYAEGIYGYRHIEKTITDLDGYGTSADWGVHVMGDLADGIISYQVSAVDGAGYRNPTFTKTIDFEGRISAQYKGFNAAIGGYTGKLGRDLQSSTVAVKTANRLNALLAYKGKVHDIAFTLGGEYFHTENWKGQPVTATFDDKANGYSIFASVSPMPKWSVFGRYDWIKEEPGKKDQFFDVGIQYSPAKIVDIALVYKRDDATGGLKVGNLGTGQATRDEIGLYGQFRF